MEHLDIIGEMQQYELDYILWSNSPMYDFVFNEPLEYSYVSYDNTYQLYKLFLEGNLKGDITEYRLLSLLQMILSQCTQKEYDRMSMVIMRDKLLSIHEYNKYSKDKIYNNMFHHIEEGNSGGMIIPEITKGNELGIMVVNSDRYEILNSEGSQFLFKEEGDFIGNIQKHIKPRSLLILSFVIDAGFMVIFDIKHDGNIRRRRTILEKVGFDALSFNSNIIISDSHYIESINSYKGEGRFIGEDFKFGFLRS